MRRRYEAQWHPEVTTTSDDDGHVEVSITKNKRDFGIKPSLKIASIDINHSDFQKRLDNALERAQERAVVLTVEQNTYNYGATRMLKKRWHWILGMGVVIGMALPDIPNIPLLPFV